MRITRVTLENWGPYRGQNEFDIEVSESSPLVVIWGGNGKGKTKFIDALKWVFSGGEFGYIKVGPYINMEAIKDGDIFETKVTVEFEQNENEFRVSRFIRIDPSQLEDPDDPQLLKRLLSMPDKTQVGLERVGHAAYSNDQARLVLLRLFPARLVNFYFFDAAELIDSFKDMSGAKGSYSSTLDIQNSVETAMGFKGFESFLESLIDLESELRDKADKEVTDRNKLTKLKGEKDKQLAQREQHDLDRQQSSRLMESKSKRLSELRETLQGMGEYLEQQRERDRFELEISTSRTQLTDKRRRISELLPSLWFAPISEKLKSQQRELLDNEAELNLWRSQVLAQKAKIERLEEGKSREKCSTCGRHMDESHKEALATELTSELSALEELENSGPVNSLPHDNQAAQAIKNSWSSGNETALSEFIATTEEIESLKIQIADRTQRISSIQAQLGSVDDINFVAVFEEIQEIEKLTLELKQNVDEATDKIAEIETKIAAIDKQILGLGMVAGGQSRVRLLKVQKLIRELSFILQELKTRVRLAIEKESNEILQSLVSQQDKQFTISIHPDYIISTDKFNPNAGFKQQVILSFLFAIPRVAKAHFPVVIDSPLQHMDASNRANFLDWCTKGLNQLVLLPHDAELEISEVPRIFGSALSKFYELLHDPATKISSVKKLSV